MMRKRQDIAVIFSWIALLALLLHGFIPHHHHNSETELCQLDMMHSASCHSCGDHSEELKPKNSLCPESHQDGHAQPHVCNFNSEKIKNISIQLVAVINNLVSIKKTEIPQTSATPYAGTITTSPPTESYLLRAPPLV